METNFIEEFVPTVSSGDSGTVSGGDAVPMLLELDLDNTDIVALLEDNNAYLSLLLEQQEQQTLSLWEKPLVDFTPTEGILLILLVVVLYVFVDEIIGGIIKWLK